MKIEMVFFIIGTLLAFASGVVSQINAGVAWALGVEAFIWTLTASILAGGGFKR